MKASKSSKNAYTTGTSAMGTGMMEARPSAVKAVQSYGPRKVSGGIMFVASFPQASSVKIAGNFNDWQPEKNPMTRAGDGSWQAQISLPKGMYRYRLVVDGQWQHDPHNDMTEPNPYGELNSIIKIT